MTASTHRIYPLTHEPMITENRKEDFIVLRVTRNDVRDVGLYADDASDEQMQLLADKAADEVRRNFAYALHSAAESLGFEQVDESWDNYEECGCRACA